jgi:hypothetical protein
LNLCLLLFFKVTFNNLFSAFSDTIDVDELYDDEDLLEPKPASCQLPVGREMNLFRNRKGKRKIEYGGFIFKHVKGLGQRWNCVEKVFISSKFKEIFFSTIFFFHSPKRIVRAILLQ